MREKVCVLTQRCQNRLTGQNPQAKFATLNTIKDDLTSRTADIDHKLEWTFKLGAVVGLARSLSKLTLSFFSCL